MARQASGVNGGFTHDRRPGEPNFDPADWPDDPFSDKEFEDFADLVIATYPEADLKLREAGTWWRSQGHTTPREIMRILDNIRLLESAEEFGLVERGTQRDGSAVIYKRDPFANLPTVGGEAEEDDKTL